jgi:cysteine-rich repeat protein
MTDSENACDDGNIINGDGCSSTCTIETGYSCNTSSNPDICTPICGDGKRIGNETCDDSLTTFTSFGDGCVNCVEQINWACSGGSSTSSDTCVPECGNVRSGTENCDDGNTISGDGCSSNCTIESGYLC